MDRFIGTSTGINNTLKYALKSNMDRFIAAEKLY